MSRKLFGTDGVRGVANTILTPEMALSIGFAAGQLMSNEGWAPLVAIGRDTRRSGHMLASALEAGFCSAGASAVRLGVVPTGMVSKVAQDPSIGLGVMVSASHNPAPDNGIKLIGPDGRKLSDECERQIEAWMDERTSERPIGRGVGDVRDAHDTWTESYLSYLESLIPERLDGMEIAVDCSNGAAYELGPEIFRRLGAELTITGANPDGMNINSECGATNPKTIQELTQTSHAAIGVAFDGDADRAVFSDSQGRLINGDRTMAIWCAHWHVDPPIVVGTVMSNGGFERYMQSKGIQVERADVGDKYVAQRMSETGAVVGGEQSGHIIFSQRGVTGDGLITAIELLRVLQRERRTASSFVSDFESMPQVLVNIQLPDKDAWKTDAALAELLQASNHEVAGKGRLNIRASGTQPMVRVMVEAESYELRDRVADRLVSAFQGELGGKIYSKVDLTHALGD